MSQNNWVKSKLAELFRQTGIISLFAVFWFLAGLNAQEAVIAHIHIGYKQYSFAYVVGAFLGMWFWSLIIYVMAWAGWTCAELFTSWLSNLGGKEKAKRGHEDASIASIIYLRRLAMEHEGDSLAVEILQETEGLIQYPERKE